MASAVQLVEQLRTPPPHTAIWRGSGSVWSLADDERHLGHIVKAGDNWLAFDATHVNESGTGFRLLGCCLSIAQAKNAVEQLFKEDRALIFTLQ